ncbi:uncharacterized protein PFL1_00911 [Pseudozyma flocculosa PF-1]|uniref:Related to BEM3 - GTPase-activating protein n=1 Tax=Pseudozyma flocculosa TaxID=84751 RepID=A0A5C3F5Z4_9BASI|nr:uncharacterized protein PFL1_00911 [Pseudozyma flocculosa PF-1]EPQ31578.1 hypothetical protein PFL1_00911 [Pseudozyma flocculosa PF-1]SPO38631.1 related to BEM3 - GTPase-activating protein [Pseudozyma flocculosa]
MAAVSSRSHRDTVESADNHAALADGASANSHASASRGGSSSISRSGSSSNTPGPLSLADALARSGNDYAAALDSVLAERNKLALDATKLNSENVRIWNLMGRIRKENEAMKAKVLELERGSSAGSTNRGSPLAPAAVISPASPASARRRLPGTWETERAGSPLNSPKPLRSPAPPDEADGGGRGNSASSGQMSASNSAYGQAFAQQQQDQTSTSAVPSNAPRPGQRTSSGQARDPLDGPSTNFDQSALASPVSPTQQSSIMQQRAAAKAQSLARVMHGNNGDSLGSGESGDFEAVDRSSVSGTDEGSVGGPTLSDRTHADSTSPSAHVNGGGIRSIPEQQQQSGSRYADGSSRVPPSPSRSMSQMSASATSAAPERRSFASRAATDDRTTPSIRSVRGKEGGRKLVLSPRLDASLLRVVGLRIVATNYKLGDRGKEAISFLITIEILQPPAAWANAPPTEATPPLFWTLEKNYSDILGLDARLRQKYGKKTAQRLAPLPDKNLFKDHAPAKVDQRKALLEIYLQALLVLELPDKDDVCTFLCTDVVPDRATDPYTTSKEGFLTKKGQNLGRWVTRFYVLRHSVLNYYETRGGAQIGSINIKEAQIGRQQKTSSASESDETSYRHAFLILEKRAGNSHEPPHIARHVLCAESDEERDEWVDVLVRAIAEMESIANGEATKATSQPSSAGLSSQTGGSLRDPTSPRDRHEDAGGSASHESTPYGHARRGDRDEQPLSPRDGVQSSNQSRASTSRRDLGGYADSAYSAPGSGQGPHGLSVNPSLPSSASSRTLGEPRSPVTRTGLARESQDIPGSPGSKHEALPRSKPAISGPMNGAPIPTGYKFGAKDEAVSAPHDGKKDDRKRFWQGFRGFGHNDKHSPREPRPVFGVPLAESIAISSIHEGLELPSVVYRCIEYLEKTNAAMEEGIYRLSGSSAVIKTLKDRFNAEGDVDLLAGEQYYDPHAIAGLLKTFLRELPTSVLTRELHLDFMRLNEIEDRTEKLNELGHLVSMLPLANYSLLRTLCSHLIKIIEHADVNKMTMRNVGIVFSPTLAIGAGIFALFLTEFDNVFFTDAKGEPAARVIEEDILAPDASELGYSEEGTVADTGSSLENASAAHSSQQGHASKARSKRNSLQYRESQAERLLGLEGRRLSYREKEEDWAGIGAGGGMAAGDMHHADPRQGPPQATSTTTTPTGDEVEVPVRRH